jgi:hypothetical protein
MAEALGWARAVEHPFTLAFACHFAATFHEARHEPDAARTLADEAVGCRASMVLRSSRASSRSIAGGKRTTRSP